MSNNPLSLSPLFSDVTNSDSKPLLILIDGHSLAFRAYYALSKSKKGALTTATGIPTSICFGFLNSLFNVIETQKPQLLAIAFDRKEPTFRHEADANYKANRQETPPDFSQDINNLQQILINLNLQIVTTPGYEADDILATLTNQASTTGYQVKILTGDRDLFQVVDDPKNISVLYLEPNAIKSSSITNYPEFNSAAVEAKLKVKPTQVIDYKALCGDASDNIPGVKGIGDKTAVKLLQQYGNLDSIYEHIAQLKGVIKTNLEKEKNIAYHCRYLVQLVSSAPVNINLEDCHLKPFKIEQVKPLLEELELKTIIPKVQNLYKQLKPLETSINDGEQLSLLSELEIPEKNLIEPKIIDTEAKLLDLIRLLKTYTNPQQPIAWDTETTSLEPREAKLVGMGCCWGDKPDEVAYIPINHQQGNCLNIDIVLAKLKPILESPTYPKVFQNTKFDRLILWYQGIKLTGVVFDTMLASYILSPESSHKLEDLATYYLGITTKSYQDLGIGKNQTIADLDIEKVANYCGMDAYLTRRLFEEFQPELSKYQELSKLLLEVELPLEAVLAKMEIEGIKINTDYLQQLSQQLEANLENLEKQIYHLAEEDFNIASPKQLGDILFEKLGLNRKKSRKTKTGYSTDHAILEKLQGDHPIIDFILEYRQLAKLKSTYVDALPVLVDDNQRIHTSFNQSVTSTGRLSSSNPNLQNIPIRTEFSRQIRQAFIPQDGWLLVAADYSQIELRILAHLSQELTLLKAYHNNEDVHTVTAKLLLEKDTITREERSLGKNINFGVIYGMGAQKFAKVSGISADIGKQFIEKYRQQYRQVFEYLEFQKKQAIALGYVTTILGRRRYFNFASYTLRKLRGVDPKTINLDELNIAYSDIQLLRAAANAPIQGSSADLIKIAMIKLDKILGGYQGKLLLQVHDELVLEIPPEEWQELQPKIKQTMEEAVTLTVPLLVDIHAGKNWMDIK